jgi:hypothetical protein
MVRLNSTLSHSRSHALRYCSCSGEWCGCGRSPGSLCQARTHASVAVACSGYSATSIVIEVTSPCCAPIVSLPCVQRMPPIGIIRWREPVLVCLLIAASLFDFRQVLATGSSVSQLRHPQPVPTMSDTHPKSCHSYRYVGTMPILGAVHRGRLQDLSPGQALLVLRAVTGAHQS